MLPRPSDARDPLPGTNTPLRSALGMTVCALSSGEGPGAETHSAASTAALAEASSLRRARSAVREVSKGCGTTFERGRRAHAQTTIAFNAGDRVWLYKIKLYKINVEPYKIKRIAQRDRDRDESRAHLARDLATRRRVIHTPLSIFH